MNEERLYLYKYLNSLISYPFNRNDRNKILELFDKLQQENEKLIQDKAYAIGYIKNNYDKFTEIEIEKNGIKEIKYISNFNIEHLLNILNGGDEE